MTATLLDGKATASAIKSELAERVAKLAADGVEARPRHGAGRRRPRQPDLRQRQAPRLRRGRDRVDPLRPAGRRDARPTSSAPSSSSTTNPACTGYIVQLPLPKGLDANARARADGPGQGRRRPSPDEPRPARARRRGAAAVHAARHRRAAAPLRRAARRRRGRRRRPRHHRRPPDGPAADAPLRELDGDALPHRHARPRRATCARPTSSSPRRASPGSSSATT